MVIYYQVFYFIDNVIYTIIVAFIVYYKCRIRFDTEQKINTSFGRTASSSVSSEEFQYVFESLK